MVRRILATLCVTTLLGALAVRAADDPVRSKAGAKSARPDDSKLDPTSAISEEAYREARLKMQFEEFKQQLLRLAQRLEKDPANKDKAAVLKRAIDKVSEDNVEVKFDKLVNLLKAQKEIGLDDLGNILRENEDLTKDIRSLIAILLTDDRSGELKRQIRELQERIKELKRIVRDEERISTQAQIGRQTGERLKGDQARATDDTRKLIGQGKGAGKESKNSKGDAKSEGKKGDPKGEGKEDTKDPKGDGKHPIKTIEEKKADPKEAKGDKAGEPKGGDPKEAKGDSKAGKPGEQSDPKGKGDGKADGKGESKPGQGGDAKSGGQSSDQSASGKGGGKSGDQSQRQQPPQDLPGQKQIKDATEIQKGAEDDFDKDQKKPGSEKVDKATDKLKDVLKKWEELLKQLREEEVERILQALQAQCERMLALQIQVREGTVATDNAVQANPDKKPTRAEDQRAVILSDDEDKIVQLAEKGVNILKDEGSAVAFTEVMIQVRDDMMNISRRLRKSDVGSLTVAIEDDVISSLREMIKALQKARQENGKPSQGGGAGGPNQQSLIDKLAELKMLRSMQVRVNERTVRYGREYEGEQAPATVAAPGPLEREKAEMLQRELRELAGRQSKIFEIANNIYKEKNK
jgi:hypothetical protein